MKRSLLICVFALITHHVLKAQNTYTVCQSGDWGNTASALLSLNGGLCNVDPNSVTFAANDVLSVPAGFTLSFTGLISISADITVDVYGTIDFDNGKLHLNHDGSTIILEVGSHITCTGAGGCSSNDQIKVGSPGTFYLYNGSELDDLENAPRPATIDNTGSVLPVIVEDFKASTKDSGVALSWVTTMEENFAEFVIEHSTDGISFSAIGTIEGQGADLYNVESKYSFVDSYPFVGRNYYRLKAVDVDNATEFFGPVLVNIKASKSIQVYPNPSKGEEVIFTMNFHPSEFDRVILVNQLGLELANIQAQSRIALPLTAELQSGIYYLKYIGKDFQTTTRILVAK
jgi:hypothetical protein